MCDSEQTSNRRSQKVARSRANGPFVKRSELIQPIQCDHAYVLPKLHNSDSHHRYQPAAAGASTTTYRPMRLEPWHILLVDDGADDREIVRQMLTRGSLRRYQFTEVETGAAALAKIRRTQGNEFACVLLDYDLPDMNAERVLAVLGSEDPLLVPPVVVMSGRDSLDSTRLLHAGAQDYVGKHWTTPDSLTRAVENAVRRFARLEEHRDAKEALRLERERLEMALTSGHMGIYDLDLRTMNYSWSPELYAVYGLDPNAFTPSQATVAALIHPDDRSNTTCVLENAIASRQPIVHEFRFLHPDGTCHWVANHGQTEYNDAGRGVRHFGVTVDITLRKRIELDLNSALVAAEKANRAKSDFLASMSHELRTPLGAILGFAQLLEGGSPPASSAQQRSIEQILKAGWYLLDLINEILDLALVESGKLSLSLEAVELSEVLAESGVMLGPLARSRNVSLSVPHTASRWSVYADRTRLKQILVNLLSNAIKYNTAGGDVAVKCAVVEAGRVRVSIQDGGDGLAPERLSELFQPFNRLGQEAGSEPGTGIGLVMCKRLVELMSGAIGMESTLGKGSEFWIELKLVDRVPVLAAPASGTPAERQARGANVAVRRLLYVEDNPANLLLVQALVESRTELCMLSAQNGIQGVEMARDLLPDVIFMDINLPGISGFQALTLLQADPLTAHTPVVALSANAMPREIQRGLAAGFFRYLTKPFKVNELLETLDEAMKLAQPHVTATETAVAVEGTSLDL